MKYLSDKNTPYSTELLEKEEVCESDMLKQIIRDKDLIIQVLLSKTELLNENIKLIKENGKRSCVCQKSVPLIDVLPSASERESYRDVLESEQQRRRRTNDIIDLDPDVPIFT